MVFAHLGQNWNPCGQLLMTEENTEVLASSFAYGMNYARRPDALEIDPVSLQVRRIHEVPGGPDCIAFAPDGAVWATLRWAGRIARLDPNTGEVSSIRVGRSPHGIFVQPRATQ